MESKVFSFVKRSLVAEKTELAGKFGLSGLKEADALVKARKLVAITMPRAFGSKAKAKLYTVPDLAEPVRAAKPVKAGLTKTAKELLLLYGTFKDYDEALWQRTGKADFVGSGVVKISRVTCHAMTVSKDKKFDRWVKALKRAMELLKG